MTRFFLLLTTLTLTVAVQAEVPATYQRIALKHGVDPVKVFQAALAHSGRPLPFATDGSRAPWPWTARLCAGERCETVFLKNRQALYAVVDAGQRAGFSLYIGPLGLPWNPQTQAQLPSLWAATQPLVNINLAVRTVALAHSTPRAEPIRSARADLKPQRTTVTAATSSPTPAAWMKPALNNPNAKRYADLITQTAEQEGINPALVHAVIAAESAYNPNAISDAEAVGLMQLMAGTAADYGLTPEERFDPQKNVVAGIGYLKFLQSTFKNDLDLVLAGYNAGHNAVIKYGYTIPPYKETKNYVKRVKKFLRRYEPRAAS